MSALKNPEAEACAQAIAKVINDRVERQRLFQAYLDRHPTLKYWEGIAVTSRAQEIARERGLASALAEQEREDALAREVFDPTVSDAQYFKSRCDYHEIRLRR